jgi:hypothetical protein
MQFRTPRHSVGLAVRRQVRFSISATGQIAPLSPSREQVAATQRAVKSSISAARTLVPSRRGQDRAPSMVVDARAIAGVDVADTAIGQHALEQPFGAIGLEVAADLVELLAAVAHHSTGLADVAQFGRQLQQAELAPAISSARSCRSPCEVGRLRCNSILTPPGSGVATPASTLDGPRVKPGAPPTVRELLSQFRQWRPYAGTQIDDFRRNAALFNLPHRPT